MAATGTVNAAHNGRVNVVATATTGKVIAGVADVCRHRRRVHQEFPLLDIPALGSPLRATLTFPVVLH